MAGRNSGRTQTPYLPAVCGTVHLSCGKYLIGRRAVLCLQLARPPSNDGAMVGPATGERRPNGGGIGEHRASLPLYAGRLQHARRGPGNASLRTLGQIRPGRRRTSRRRRRPSPKPATLAGLSRRGRGCRPAGNTQGGPLQPLLGGSHHALPGRQRLSQCRGLHGQRARSPTPPCHGARHTARCAPKAGRGPLRPYQLH